MKQRRKADSPESPSVAQKCHLAPISSSCVRCLSGPDGPLDGPALAAGRVLALGPVTGLQSCGVTALTFWAQQQQQREGANTDSLGRIYLLTQIELYKIRA